MPKMYAWTARVPSGDPSQGAFRTGRSNQYFPDKSHASIHAKQHPEVEFFTRGTSLCGEMQVATYDSDAYHCAPGEVQLRPSCLRCRLPHNPAFRCQKRELQCLNENQHRQYPRDCKHPNREIYPNFDNFELERYEFSK